MADRILNKTWARIEEIEDAVVAASSIVTYQSEANRLQITTNAIADTYQKMDIVLDVETGDLVGTKLSIDTVNKRIVHTGATTKYFFNATATIDESNSVNNNIHFAAHKNDVAIEKAVSYALLVATAPNADAQNLNAASSITMDDGDYIEVWSKSDKAGSTFYCNHLALQLHEDVAKTLE